MTFYCFYFRTNIPAVLQPSFSIVDRLLSTLHSSANRIFELWGQRIFHWLWLCGQSLFSSRVAALVSRVSRLCPSRARALLSLNLTKKRDCSQCKGAIFLHTKILYVTSSALWLVRSPECEWPQDVICSVIGSKYWIGMSSIVPFVLWNLSKRILLCDWLHAISTPLTTTVAKVQ